MQINRIFLIYLALIFILTNQVIAISTSYCPPVSAIKCSNPLGCNILSNQYKNWQMVNEFVPDQQSLTSFNSAYIFDDSGADGVFGTVECFYSGPEHGYAEVRTHTNKSKSYFYPKKASSWNYTYAPNFKYFYNCVANEIKSCGFTEAPAK